MSDPVLIFIIAVITVGYGTAVSFVEERIGKFQDLSASQKQTVNALLTFILPIIVAFVQPYWKPEYGDATQVITSALMFIIPGLMWVISQIAHNYDPAKGATK